MATDQNPIVQRWFALALVSLGAIGNAAAGSPEASRSQCEIGAFVQETDPVGLNVRAAPHAKAKVLGKLVPVYVDPEQGYRTRAEVEVVASEGGWFLIRNARDNPDMTGQAERPMYRGKGFPRDASASGWTRSAIFRRPAAADSAATSPELRSAQSSAIT